MQTLHYSIHIQAAINLVHDKMLGLSSKSSYEQWTAAFNPTSTYEGSWDEGGKIYFVGTDEKGNKGGMVSRIQEHRAPHFVSIKHLGMLQGDKEITSGPEVEQWANSFENYSLSEENGGTKVEVSLQTTADFESYMNEAYPKALQVLKELCEA